ncbi:MAG: glycoside hydrolase family 130 protein [Kiritimatiellae bacterium]|nr:glycoside hydrolase family 130 protein [Kiritimatiellia bacterium]
MKYIRRHSSNPILSARDIPYDASLIFNAGVAKWQGEYVMLFRNDYGQTEESWRKTQASGQWPHLATNIGIARSRDGVHWTAGPKPVFQMRDDEIQRVYDPRLTIVEGRPVLCFAMDTKHGLRGGIATTDDFERFEVQSLSVPDNRNMALFPERVGGCFVRLERPMPVYSHGGGEHFDIWLSESPDLRFWGESRLVMGAERVPYATGKIGPAAPPVKTPRGWLATFHAVRYADQDLHSWEGNWRKEYCAGLMLLDLDDPSKVIGLSREPLLVAEEPYETNGFRGSVIFPGGMILEDSGEVKIYYGAADTVECLATAHIDDLLAFCEK